MADPKLGNAIGKLPGLEIKAVADSSTTDVYRAIRTHLTSLIPGLLPSDVHTMSLGLSHSLSRHKLKFSPDKVDSMIIQAIALLDDLDKELNQYAMRVKEWYGWHFPEMAKIINDNAAYSRVILKAGMRTNFAETDLADILPEEIETAVKAAADVSMGTEVTDEDMDNIKALAEQVVSFSEYRQQLSSYLSARMHAIAPNLTTLVGELVGARLIAHSGSLMNLAKSPASTIQILGAEKALFRALKTKHDTPKYGLIYHASLVGQASGRNKGKVARMLAAKTALGLRIDSLSDWGTQGEGEVNEPTEEEKTEVGMSARAYIERKLRALEGKPLALRGAAIGPAGQTQPGKWEVKEARKYNPDADGLSGNEPAAAAPKVNGVIKSAKKRKVEAEPKKAIAAEDSGSEEEDADESMVNGDEEDATPQKSSVRSDDKAQRKAEREAKRARKAERAAKREAKAAKKAEKAAKKGAQVAKAATEGVLKKRKREEGVKDDGEKKKKKKKSKD